MRSHQGATIDELLADFPYLAHEDIIALPRLWRPRGRSRHGPSRRLMHFPIDAQLPPTLCSWFVEQGHEASHVAELLGGQTPDSKIADYARTHNLTLITKDHDFVSRHPTGGYRLIWLRCGNITNRALRSWLDQRRRALFDRLEEGERLIEVR